MYNGIRYPHHFASAIIFFGLHSVHICVTMLHTEEGVAEKFVQDVMEVVKEIKMDPTAVPTGAVNYLIFTCW